MFAAGLLVGWSSEAFAYRPFDGTDAAVADLGEAEVRFLLQAPTSLAASGAFLKHVIRPGSLQDQSGPSIAAEFGVLLPDSSGDSRFGASIDAIVSQRWEWGTVHLNMTAEVYA
jgi:hypothetical protein